MKLTNMLALILCLMLVSACLLPMQATAAEATEILWTEGFDGGTAGDAVIGRNSWFAANEYTYPNRADNEYKLGPEEAGSTNMVAAAAKTITDSSVTDKNRLWFARELELPADTTQVIIEFKIRYMNASGGNFEIGFRSGDGTSWPSNGHVRLVLGTKNVGIFKDVSNYTYYEKLTAEQGLWQTVKIAVNTETGYLNAWVNGAASGGDRLSKSAIFDAGMPTAVGFGWNRNAVGAEAQLDDITVSIPRKMRLLDTTPSAALDVGAPLELHFSNPIDAASLASAQLSLEGGTPAVSSCTVSTEDASKLLVSFHQPLDYETTYNLSVAGIKDTTGQSMTAASFSFTTRPRRLLIDNPRFYTNYSSAPTEVTSFVRDTVTAAAVIDNEMETETTAVMVAVLKSGDVIKNVACSPVTVPAGQSATAAVTLDTSAGDNLTVMLWDSLSGMLPVAPETTLSAQGISLSSETGAAVAAVTAEPDYDSSVLSVMAEAAADNGAAGYVLLRPGYALSALTAANVQQAVESIGQITTGQPFTYDFSALTAAGDNTYTIAVGGKDQTMPLFGTAVVSEVLTLLQTADNSRLSALLDTQNPEQLSGGYYLNDVLRLPLSELAALQDKTPVLSAIAGKAFGSLTDCKAAFEAALTAQKNHEDTIAALLADINAADWSGLESLLTTNDSLLLLSWTGSYANLSTADRTMLYKHLAEDYTFTTLQEVGSAFSYWADTLYAAALSGGSSSGGGGGGSSSRGGSSRMEFGAFEQSSQTAGEENTAPVFTDCGNVPWAQEAIYALAAQGIVSGVGDGLFEPEASVTREQFVQMLVKAFGIHSGGQKPNFTDVPADAWYYDAVAAAYSQGIVKGLSDTSFGTGTLITRADMAVLCVRAMTYKGITLPAAALTFADSGAIPEYAKDSIGALCGAGLMNGVGDNQFAPAAYANRAMAAKLLYSIVEQNL